jgi:hypothetical protein
MTTMFLFKLILSTNQKQEFPNAVCTNSFNLFPPFNHLNYTKGSILFFLPNIRIIPKVLEKQGGTFGIILMFGRKNKMEPLVQF